jgi:hypothetical protein
LTCLSAAFWLALVAGSKGQHSAFALLSIPAFLVPAGRRGFPPVVIRAISVAMIAGAAWLALGTVPVAFAPEGDFSALFYRILPAHSDPAAYLGQTRIPVSWARYTGMNAFSPGSPLTGNESKIQFNSWFGRRDLIRLYATHPSDAWRMMMVSLDEGSLDRVRMKTGAREHRLGNYEYGAGKPPQALSYFFAMWPAAKYRLIAGRPLVYLAYMVVVFALFWLWSPKVRGMRLWCGIITLGAAAEWAVSLMDGGDAGRHLVLYNLVLDLVLCCVVVFAVWRVRRGRKGASADQYAKAYGSRSGLGAEFTGWEDEGSWPEE